MNGLTITPADHGGYVVWSDARFGDERHYPRAMLFAGSLTDALDFMRKTLAEQAEARAAVPEGRLAA
jgi:hypothetical protein